MTTKQVLGGVAAALGAVGLGRVALGAMQRRHGMRLAGKVAVVCGGSRGLGLAVARALAKKGCNVAICGRSSADVEAARDELSGLGVAIYAEACDLTVRPEVDRFLRNVVARLGDIDVLVANAATMLVAPIETLDVVDFDRAMSSVFKTSLHASLGVLPSMRARGKGTIAFITSIGGKIGVPHLAPYSAAKFAEIGLAQSLGAEVAKDGVHVLTVVPGLMRTGGHVHAQYRGDVEKEFTWFGGSANLPLVTIEPDRAARRIVRAIETGKSQLTYTVPARIAVRLHDLMPNVFAEALGLMARMLPRPDAHARRGAAPPREGIDIERESSSPLVAAVKARGQKFAERYGQLRAT